MAIPEYVQKILDGNCTQKELNKICDLLVQWDYEGEDAMADFYSPAIIEKMLTRYYAGEFSAEFLADWSWAYHKICRGGAKFRPINPYEKVHTLKDLVHRAIVNFFTVLAFAHVIAGGDPFDTMLPTLRFLDATYRNPDEWNVIVAENIDDRRHLDLLFIHKEKPTFAKTSCSFYDAEENAADEEGFLREGDYPLAVPLVSQEEFAARMQELLSSGYTAILSLV